MSLCDSSFFSVVVVVGATVVDVVLVLDVVVVDTRVVDVVVDDVVVVDDGATTVNVVLASSVALWARTSAGPALAAGGTLTSPEKLACPLESAVPILVIVGPWTKSMMMQLGVLAGHAL